MMTMLALVFCHDIDFLVTYNVLAAI